MSSLRTNLLALIGELSAEDLQIDTNSSTSHEKIENSILVLVPNTRKQAELNSFFKILNFTNTEVQLFSDDIPYRKFDIIIFDNRDLKPTFKFKKLDTADQVLILERTQLMEQLLDSSFHYFLIHFGNMLHWLNEHRDRCNAANSKFTLYNNIKQLVDFINRFK